MSKTVRNRGFPGSSDDEVSACNVGDLGSIPESGRSPGEGNGNPLQYSCLENSMRSLVGYSPWDLKELDMTGQHIDHPVYGILLWWPKQTGPRGNQFPHSLILHTQMDHYSY